ncbi:membrane associated guanylate kinase, WW and PDZ domain containing protein magi isoform 1-T2 [Cochliomyia hominivorax]
MPSLAARNSTAITNATMTTISNNNLDATTSLPSSSSSSSSSSSVTSISNINVSGTCTFSTSTTGTNAVVSATSNLTGVQQQQQQYQEEYVQQQHHQKYNYYQPPPAVGNYTTNNNNNSSTNNNNIPSNNSSSDGIIPANASCLNTNSTTSTTTGLATFNGNSNLENVAVNGNNNINNTNNFNSNYNNGISSSVSSSNSNNTNINSITSPGCATASVVSANSVICHKTDTTISSGSILNSGSSGIVGLAPTSAFKKQQQQLHASREDIASLGGSSSLNSQISTNNINNNNNNFNTITTTTVNGSGNCSGNNVSYNNHNLNSILKGSKENILQNNYCNGSIGGSTTGSEGIEQGSLNIPEHDDPGDGLGPLPPKWETAYTERGELYFIDHNTGTSHWLDPRLSKYQKKSLEECGEDELPYGWEKIEDSLYGTYYIDHVNRKTQYENPVLEAKRRAAEQKQQQQQEQQQQQQQQHQNSNSYQHQQHQLSTQRPQTPSTSSVLNGTNASIALSSVSSASTLSTVDISQRAMQPPPPMTQEQNANKPALLPYKFTRNPTEMQGERITATLLKSARGLGITIVGGDDGVEEFLQIKSIVPNGPAWLDGQLQMGDVLVYVNDTCVLGFTHHEMVNVFQSIMPGETVTLEVCRGYPLPFDPNDPNTEVVTTIAVDGISSHEPDKQRRMLMDLNMDGNYNFLDISGASSNGGNQHNMSTGSAIDNSGFILMKKPEVHTFSIIKGAMGFGFTITDSSYGQKVKKILDRSCCHQLQEGDILLEINDIVVRNKSHVDVVQILKDCSKTEPTLVKIQRPVTTTSSTTATNSVSPNSAPSSAGGNNTVAKLRKNFLGATTGGIGNNALFRSKTPTADLYSTMQKEILPIRPKTPLVDTRRARVNTPNMELNEDREVAAVNTSAEESALERSLAESKTLTNEGSKSQNSLSEIDAINHDIPFMDPYPKMVTSLSERLAGVSMNSEGLHNNSSAGGGGGGYLRTTASGVPNYENQGDYVSAGSGNYSSIYGLAQMPPVMSPLSGGLYGPPAGSSATTTGLIAPVTGVYHHHHESCFCYECQEYRNNRLRNTTAGHNLQPPTHQQQQSSPRNYYSVYHPTQHGHSQYSPASSGSLQAAHIQNERMQKRVNELLNDRRRVGFSPLDHHQHHNQMQVNTAVAAGGGYSPSQQQYLHQHPTHGLINQLQQQQHSPAQQQPVNWSNNGTMNFNSMQPAGGLLRNGFPETGDILDGSGEQFVLSEVTLQRQALGFGFRIVGGTEEGSQVTVGHIVPGGAADNDHRITTGDEILSIDGINVVNSSHHKVVSLMGEAALRGQVTMILRRRTRPGMSQPQMQQHTMPVHLMAQQSMSGTSGLLQHPSPLQPLLRNNPVRYPYDVIVTRHENEGFGFVIISSSNQYYGSTIGKLIPGSPADRCGELKVGDRIIAVNRIDIAGMSHGDVVNLIKESGLHVRLTIGCPKEGAIINAAPTTPAGSGISVLSGNGSAINTGGLLLNSTQASPGQVSQTLTPTLQTNLDLSNQYFERPLLSGGSNAGSATSSLSNHQQPAQQSPNPLPVPPQL